jgi:hypothetical protein
VLLLLVLLVVLAVVLAVVLVVVLVVVSVDGADGSDDLRCFLAKGVVEVAPSGLDLVDLVDLVERVDVDVIAGVSASIDFVNPDMMEKGG